MPGRQPRRPSTPVSSIDLMSDTFAVIRQLRFHPPFDSMSPEHLEFLAQRLVLGLYPKGQPVLAPGEEEPGHFFIVRDGRVDVEPMPGSSGEEDAGWELG